MADRKHAYLIKWEDSCSEQGWKRMVDKFGAIEITTLGWLLEKTETHVTVTTSISYHGGVMDPLSIPRSCIKSMKRLPHHIDAI